MRAERPPHEMVSRYTCAQQQQRHPASAGARLGAVILHRRPRRKKKVRGGPWAAHEPPHSKFSLQSQISLMRLTSRLASRSV